MKLKIILILLALTLLGTFLRLCGNTQNPVSLTVDEVAFGYNAYSILKTSRDEYGSFLPLTFKSVGDYKNPVPIYSMVPFIALLGLNEFSIRLPTAIISILSIPIFYLFLFEITKSRKVSILGTFLITISAWHIVFSRYVSDHLMAMSFVTLGGLFFLKIKSGRLFNIPLSAFFFILSMYTYYAERLFVPILLFALVLLNIKTIALKKLIIFITCCVIFVSPLAYSTFFGPDINRAKMTFITSDVEFHRNVALDEDMRGNSFFDQDYPQLFFYWARKYLYYFHPTYLFASSLNLTTPGIFGLGVIYLFELPLLILGIISLIKNKIPQKGFVIIWLLIGLIPASLTVNEQHSGRTLVILPMLLLLSSVGGLTIFSYIKNLRPLRRYLVILILIGLMFWNLIYAYLIYTVHYPNQRSEDLMDGTKEAVLYALENKEKYQEIVFDPYRGIEAPYIVSIPHMYILFYSQYDPSTYQKEDKEKPDNSFHFDKFTIRRINWVDDHLKEDTLFIGSPWSFPESGLKEEELLKKVHMVGGQPAFYIVTPK